MIKGENHRLKSTDRDKGGGRVALSLRKTAQFLSQGTESAALGRRGGGETSVRGMKKSTPGRLQGGKGDRVYSVVRRRLGEGTQEIREC